MNKILLFLLPLFLVTTGDSSILAETRMEKYFENTDHELMVYHINGKEPGKTIMIIGGIQGDEPGGYIAADLYADLLLEKGNLIVVPRANFYSIKRNARGVNGDMNRKFSADPPPRDDYDSRIVEILKGLMQQSDVLLNLHEGSGFYYPEYVSDLKNPMRYGQSIIIDTLEYHVDSDEPIELVGPATRVIEEINHNIKDPEHTFHLNNHDTFSSQSRHKEQRGSATYNALTIFGIPGFGIETSKNITSIETKVKYETLAINAFMREYGIVPEHPSVYLPTPELDHLVITTSGNQNPLAVKNGAALSIPSGTAIKVTSVVANYKRGISVDILKHGNTNDINREAVIHSPTVIKVYKDGYTCGNVAIDISNSENGNMAPHIHVVTLDQIKIQVDDKIMVVSPGDTLHIVRGDLLRIVDASLTDPLDTDFRVNFKGFVGNKSYNDAEDRGYDIDTSRNLMKNYSIDQDRGLYRIEVSKGGDVIGVVFIAIDEPEIQYVIVENSDRTKQALSPGDIVSCDNLASLKILSVISNVTARPYIDTFISDGNGDTRELKLPAMLEIPPGLILHFRRTSVDLGSISFVIGGKS